MSQLRIRTAGSRAGARRPVAGFSLVEVMVVFVILTVAMAFFTSTISSTARQRATKRESVLAAEGARRMLEVMRSQQFSKLFALYDVSSADDPSGPGTAPGRHFSVPGLSPRDGDPDGFVGEIRFASSGPALLETDENELLGFPRDVSADDEVDGADHSGDYVLLPVHVRLEWRGAGGERKLDLFTSFSSL